MKSLTNCCSGSFFQAGSRHKNLNQRTVAPKDLMGSRAYRLAAYAISNSGSKSCVRSRGWASYACAEDLAVSCLLSPVVER